MSGRARPPLALTREITDAITRCELTHLSREPIDLRRAREQHAAYEHCLRELGCTVVRLPADPAHGDAVFIEDTAVVLDEVAIMARPGAESRRGETGGVARALADYRPGGAIEAPATLDGGDVLVLGRTVLVGLSRRTDEKAAAQVARILAPWGYVVRTVTVTGCLHLKTAVTSPAEGILLLNPEWIEPSALPAWDLLPVDPAEPFAANVLRVEGRVLVASHAPRTRERLEGRGLPTSIVQLAELAKAEGGLTCCSLILARSG